MKKSIILAVMAATSVLFTNCGEDNVKNVITSFVAKADDLKGDIASGTTTLDASKTYKLTGPLVVKKGATLNIPAGTTIKSDPNGKATSMYIAVERGATINIEGTAGKPVVMTSGKATPKESDWGGLVICGDAKVNTGDNGTSEVGGLSYGGNNNDDSSGKIEYLSIKYTGAKFSSDKEFNGVSFFGVGSKTVISNIYAYESGDDGIEFFGGAANASNLIIVNSYDDSLDFADGYQGTITNVYISGVSKAGVEGSNNGKNDIAEPMTNATIKNISIVKGTDSKFEAQELAINFKEGGGKQTYINLFVNGIETFAKLDSGSGATARIAAGDFKVNDKKFMSDKNTTEDYVSNETGAGSGKDMPEWASWAK